jgi:hypothetical protein
MDMGVGAFERGRQTVYFIRRGNYFKGFLGTLVQGQRWLPIVKEGSAPRNHEITRWEIKDFEPRIHTEECYGHGSGGK